jgi:branched-chain amino acid transport system ATP-binding protein
MMTQPTPHNTPASVAAATAAPVLEIAGLTQQFGGLRALSDFNVALEPGQITGLIGPNGAGKTTVFNLVSGFYQPTTGQIRVNGHLTAGLKPHKVTALGVARTFQNIRLWNDMTVLDNIRVAQHYRLGYGFFDSALRTRRYQEREAEITREAFELLDVFDMKAVAGGIPQKTCLTAPSANWRLPVRCPAIPACCCSMSPLPVSNSSNIKELIRLVRWIHETFQVSIWMIEHHMDVVMQLCSQIKVIDFGQTIAEGTPETDPQQPGGHYRLPGRRHALMLLQVDQLEVKYGKHSGPARHQLSCQ